MNDIIYGRKLVREALENNENIDKVLVDKDLRGADEIRIRRLCTEKRIPFKAVPIQKLDRLSRENHQGVIAVIAPIQFQELEDVIPHIYDRGRMPYILVLDRITDVRNLAAIARSAEIFDVDAILFSSKNSAEINALTIKISAGALLRIPVCRVHSIIQALEYLKDSGIRICCSVLNAEKKLYEMNFNEPIAVVIGSEDQGASREVIQESSESFTIPQIGETESLNASVAAGVILYEMAKQRKTI